MKIRQFQKARTELTSGPKWPPRPPGEYSNLWKQLHMAAGPEHVGKCVGVTMDDQVVCCCGWESRTFWDGAEWAWDEWREHVADEMGLLPKECPCGKKYIPANGGKPCHELTEL